MKTVNIVDVGDMSVGIPSMTVVSVQIDDEMYDLMKEQKTKLEFEKKLKALVEEFYEPEIKYDFVDEYEEEQMYREFYEEKENEND